MYLCSSSLIAPGLSLWVPQSLHVAPLPGSLIAYVTLGQSYMPYVLSRLLYFSTYIPHKLRPRTNVSPGLRCPHYLPWLPVRHLGDVPHGVTLGISNSSSYGCDLKTLPLTLTCSCHVLLPSFLDLPIADRLSCSQQHPRLLYL